MSDNNRNYQSIVLLLLIFIALLLSFMCCAGLLSGMWFHLNNTVEKGFVEDPVVAEEKTVEAFGELNLPENIKPRGFYSVDLFVTDLAFTSAYNWELNSNDDNNKGVISFYSCLDVFKEILKEQFTKDLTVKHSEIIPIIIKGKPCDFTFSLVENKYKANFLMVSGSFTSSKETQCNVFILLPGEPSQETVINVLENIQK